MDVRKDEELKKILANLERPQPSDQLLGNIMDAVHELPTPVVSQPLIGKKGWWLIALCFAAATIGLFFFNPAAVGLEIPLNTPKLDLSMPQIDWKMPFNGSNTLLYAVLFMGIFFGLQIKMLKKEFLSSPEQGQFA
ncbi:hypothetical protein [Sediminicola luteus]|uniref:Uncharacterized protein n=1 Tax=Sediminicola luteus TaxID=319238 RepID=A0A2A4GEP5_9FLAO|nr:hypothetical protein [Sediminicola luteus]PCE66450.1 hypothetical protein B7P33_03915 [Sediminicola luteus]